jgi:uncharacterized membrane protein
MNTELQRTVGELFFGWAEIVSLFVFLVVTLFLLGWAFNRKAKPKDRGNSLPWQLLLPAFGAALLLRQMDPGIIASIIICIGVLAASFLAGGSERGPYYICGMILAALVGLGFMLSAMFFVGIVFLIILIFPSGR